MKKWPYQRLWQSLMGVELMGNRERGIGENRIGSPAQAVLTIAAIVNVWGRGERWICHPAQAVSTIAAIVDGWGADGE